MTKTLLTILIHGTTKSNRNLQIMMVDQPKFIVDCMGGNIAKKLRIMGFDTEFLLDASDDFLINKCICEQKVLVTRDQGLYLRISKLDRNGLLLYNDDELENLVIIFERCSIRCINPVPNVNTRCTICNGTLKKLDKTKVPEPIPRKVYENISTIYQCPKCSKAYWEGTHIENINKFIDKINNLLSR
jgi:uncharacterized protein with PIN domain